MWYSCGLLQAVPLRAAVFGVVVLVHAIFQQALSNSCVCCPAVVCCRQYHYVLQSLMLWREVSNDMFKLWYLAEADMLRQGTSYRLCDTGQGLNRVQVGAEA